MSNNYVTEAKNIYLKGIRGNKNIPTYAKAELEQVISRQFQIMSQYIGTVELLYLREQHFKKQQP
jgi:hypothetical protein